MGDPSQEGFNQSRGESDLMKIIKIVANCDLERDDPQPRT